MERVFQAENRRVLRTLFSKLATSNREGAPSRKKTRLTNCFFKIGEQLYGEGVPTRIKTRLANSFFKIGEQLYGGGVPTRKKTRLSNYFFKTGHQ